MRDIDELAHTLIGIGIEVHRQLGPGLPESTYERAFCIELKAAKIPYRQQLAVAVMHKGVRISEYRPDLVVDDAIVVEVKSVDRSPSSLAPTRVRAWR